MIALVVSGCSSTPRVLVVKTEPADAEVCIKGKNRSKYFTNAKQCIGTTPLEVENVVVQNADGKKEKVEFKDVETQKEQFYLIVSRPGYVPQSINVPEWEHTITLKQEIVYAPPMAPVNAAPPPSELGSIKINSNPVGALVYVNDFLKGNTPYMVEAKPGEVLRVKLEQTGYVSLEKSISIESGKASEVNFSLEESRGGHAPASAPRSDKVY